MSAFIASFYLTSTILYLIWRIKNVRKVRYQRVEIMMAKYAHLTEDFEAMTYQDATDILKVSHIYDCPLVLTGSTSLAVFQTYAVPSISTLLARTELSSEPSIARRAEDTAIFLTEFLTQGIDSERGSLALARMNWIHGRYGSRISNEDFLFTLALFIQGPAEAVNKYDWRPLTKLEEQARYIFWREVGARMGITAIPRSRAEFIAWLEDYSTKKMSYHPTNKKVANDTLEVLLRPLSKWLKPLGRTYANVLLPGRVRRAFGWQTPSSFYFWLFPIIFHIRGLLLRNLFYPRADSPAYFKTEEVVDEVDSEKKIIRGGFIFEPWYVPQESSRIGLLAVGVPGLERWKPRGYSIAACGPEKLCKAGIETTVKEAQAMRDRAAVCPFFV